MNYPQKLLGLKLYAQVKDSVCVDHSSVYAVNDH